MVFLPRSGNETWPSFWSVLRDHVFKDSGPIPRDRQPRFPVRIPNVRVPNPRGALFFYKACAWHPSATTTAAATTRMISSPLYRRILKSRDASYRGSSTLQIPSFYIPDKYTPREFDRKNVDRLKRIFKQEGLRRISPENRIPVLLGKEESMSALRRSNLCESDLITHRLQDMPAIEAPKHSIRYLHGHHRLAAAKEFLAPSEQWWGVDIYLDTGL